MSSLRDNQIVLPHVRIDLQTTTRISMVTDGAVACLIDKQTDYDTHREVSAALGVFVWEPVLRFPVEQGTTRAAKGIVC